MKYNELKFDGKIYSEQYKIDEILIDQGFKWMVNAEIENARLEILKGTLIWNAGIWYNGNWEFGVFRDGEWKYGTWENGVWYNGKWKDGTFKSGIIERGIFVKGKILGGEIRGGKFIDCEIGPRVKEYVEGEKEQEKQELQAPVIEPVQSQSNLHVVVKEEKKNNYIMKKIKNFNGFINENNYNAISPDDIFSYLDINTPEYVSEGEYVLTNMTEWDDSFEFYGEDDEIQDYFDGRNIIIIRPIDDMWELTFDYQDGNHDNFIKDFIYACQRLLGTDNVLIDDPSIAQYLESVSIKESTGDIETQFVGNRYDNVNVKQVAGGIELSSHSKTDIYNMKQIHGGEVVEKENGLYVLYIDSSKKTL